MPAIDEKPHRSWVEIDLDALRHNARVAQHHSGSAAPAVIAVIKADAYGHGSLPVARALAHEVFAFAVANVREAAELRAGGVTTPIYLLGPALDHERREIIQLCAKHRPSWLCPAISQEQEARAYAQLATEAGIRLKVHLVVDTGMGRIGCLPDEALSIARAIANSPSLELQDVASHFPSSDEDESFTSQQEEKFRHLLGNLTSSGIHFSCHHIANSAGILGFPAASGHLVRAGLMLYGVSPQPAHQQELRTVMTWKARVTLVREVPTGWSISYGRTFTTTRPTRLALLPVGYADGYRRHLSGTGAWVVLHGTPCPVIGRITMDQIMVDATDVPATSGDEAILLGATNSAAMSATQMAQKSQTIPWDIFTGIGHRVDRVYFN